MEACYGLGSTTEAEESLMTHPSVVICMPCYGLIDPDTFFSFINLYNANRPIIRAFIYRGHLYIDQARNALVEDFLKCDGATHCLFLDSDMTWPPHAPRLLLEANVPVVSGLYFDKKPPHNCTAGTFVTPSTTVPLSELPSRLKQVDTVGCGCLLIEKQVFQRLEKPWFRSNEVGEDIYFCRKLKDAGIGVWVDGRVRCGHIGRRTVTDEDWEHHRPAYKSDAVAY